MKLTDLLKALLRAEPAPRFVAPALIRMSLVIVGAMTLAACGAGDGASAPEGAASPPTAVLSEGLVTSPVAPTPVPEVELPRGRGELKQATPINTIEAQAVAAALVELADKAPAGLVPLYAVKSVRLSYVTVDGQGQEVVASGLVAVPQKGGGRSPVLGYQHGTKFNDAEAPSNNVVASEVPLILASLGFIVVAPDYVGYGSTKGMRHPYLAAAPTAAAVLDLLTAAQTWRRLEGVADNGQLFLTGYSEGGYATMAAHRALQTQQHPQLAQLVMALPGGGPYSVQVTMDKLLDRVQDEYPVLGHLISPGLLRYLGSSVRKEVRRLLLRALIPDDADVVFSTAFIDHYLADDEDALERESNVHRWTPHLPVRLFHGQQDQTVPYQAASVALSTMQQLGAGSVVSLTDCQAPKSSHMGCVPPFIGFVLQQMAPYVLDL